MIWIGVDAHKRRHEAVALGPDGLLSPAHSPERFRVPRTSATAPAPPVGAAAARRRPGLNAVSTPALPAPPPRRATSLR
jgi:hypothetical protein